MIFQHYSKIRLQLVSGTHSSTDRLGASCTFDSSSIPDGATLIRLSLLGIFYFSKTVSSIHKF